MTIGNFIKEVSFIIATTSLVACQSVDISQLVKKPLSAIKSEKSSAGNMAEAGDVVKSNSTKSLNEIIAGAKQKVDLGPDFKSAIKTSLEVDPLIAASRQTLKAKTAALDILETEKDFKVSSTIFGGIEDVSDSATGIAMVLNASRMLFDGGALDSLIAKQRYGAQAAEFEMRATIDDRALVLGKAWIQLERYEELQTLIDSRLAVLDPLISQLEQVAKAGIGDVSKVTAAQRTVSIIRVSEANIAESLAQARVEYLNLFGSMPVSSAYDAKLVSTLIPLKITDDTIYNSPLLKAQYAAYLAAEANASVIIKKNEFNIGFEARATVPFGGSNEASDESLGLVATKTLFNKKGVESELREARAFVEGAIANMRSTYREGERTVKTAQQNIKSMEKGILLARDQAELTAAEIVYLRRQLVIGGSTLDSVLSAEARLYDAEAQEINFKAEKRISELNLLSVLGLFTAALDG